MISRPGIAVLLLFVLAAGPAWVLACSADKTQTLASCVLTGTSKSPTATGGFNEWYSLENTCGYDVDVIIKASNGDEATVTLSDKQTSGASLPENVEVTGFYCCSDDTTCKVSGDTEDTTAPAPPP